MIFSFPLTLIARLFLIIIKVSLLKLFPLRPLSSSYSHKHIDALLGTNDFESIKLVEREQAASRHLMITLRLLQLRQRYAEAGPSVAEQALLDALFYSTSEDSQPW